MGAGGLVPASDLGWRCLGEGKVVVVAAAEMEGVISRHARHRRHRRREGLLVEVVVHQHPTHQLRNIERTL